MADSQQQLDKRLVVCPLSFALGYGQNYRVTERPNRGILESRPVKNTDAFAEDFFRVLHAEKGETVTVTHSTGKEIKLRGLGQPDAQALKFSMRHGLKARQDFVQAVNEGKLRAPKKNWDKTYGPELMYTYTDPKTGEESRYQLGGGTDIEELKQEYPELYGQKTSRRSNDSDEGMIDDDALDALETDSSSSTTRTVSQPMSRTEDDLEGLANEIEGEGAYTENREQEIEDEEAIRDEIPDESYAAVAVADDIDVYDETPADLDLEFEDNTGEGESAAQASARGELSGAAKMRHDLKEDTGSGRIQEFDDPRTLKQTKQGTGHSIGHAQQLTIKVPNSATAIKSNAIKYMANDTEHTAYKVRCPNDNTINWFEEGENFCRSCGSKVNLKTT